MMPTRTRSKPTLDVVFASGRASKPVLAMKLEETCRAALGGVRVDGVLSP